MTRRAAIVSPLRSPIGKFGGAFRDLPVEDLGAQVVKAVVARSGIDPTLIEDLVFAQSYANSETPASGAGWPCLPGCRSRCRACSSTGAAAAVCNPSRRAP